MNPTLTLVISGEFVTQWLSPVYSAEAKPWSWGGNICDTTVGTVQLKYDGTRWRTGGEVKGKLANGVGSSTLHTPSELGVSSITTADAHTSAVSTRLKWRPRRFKWTRPFRRKTKSGFCACATTFQTQSNTRRGLVPTGNKESFPNIL